MSEPDSSLPAVSSWTLYVLRCGDGTLYCGITTNVERRLANHVAGRGARYTRGRGPLLLLASWPAGTRADALRAEAAFKSLSRASKERRLAQDREGGPGLPA